MMTTSDTRRDVYKREVKLAYWINRVHKESMLTEADKEDILRFIDFMQRGHPYV